MPIPGPNDPALMTPDLARTFFHEFGHLLHTIFSGRQRGQGGSPAVTSRILSKRPSQMLEEWWRNPKVLTRFARHYKTGEPIDASLVERMVRAGRFGEALRTRGQLSLASLSSSFIPAAQSRLRSRASRDGSQVRDHAKLGRSTQTVLILTSWTPGLRVDVLHLSLVARDCEGLANGFQSG